MDYAFLSHKINCSSPSTDPHPGPIPNLDPPINCPSSTLPTSVEHLGRLGACIEPLTICTCGSKVNNGGTTFSHWEWDLRKHYYKCLRKALPWSWSNTICPSSLFWQGESLASHAHTVHSIDSLPKNLLTSYLMLDVISSCISKHVARKVTNGHVHKKVHL